MRFRLWLFLLRCASWLGHRMPDQGKSRIALTHLDRYLDDFPKEAANDH